MTYSSQISFTLDTICPWTYLAFRRLRIALDEFSTKYPNSAVNFTLHYYPYQLYPEFSSKGVDKQAWYLKERYNSEASLLQKYETVMRAHGSPVGISFKFGGLIANTLDAHRVIQYFQDEKGEAVAGEIVSVLFRLYFENEAHPSSEETLVKACVEAGISEEEAKRVVADESEGMMETKMAIREQAGNGIDSVPHVMFEGKKRDFTLQGAKEVEEYVRALEQVVKEAR